MLGFRAKVYRIDPDPFWDLKRGLGFWGFGV